MVGALNETRDMTRARLGCLELKLRDDNGVDLYLTRRNGGMILLDSLSAAELERSNTMCISWCRTADEHIDTQSACLCR